MSQSNASDVRELCTTLLNCYLIQLLETGFLHADPHTGPLSRAFKALYVVFFLLWNLQGYKCMSVSCSASRVIQVMRAFYVTLCIAASWAICL